MRASLKTLSPVHVGSGEKINPLSYLCVGGEVFVLSDEALRLLPSGMLDRFVSWVTSTEPRDRSWYAFASTVGGRWSPNVLATRAKYRASDMAGGQLRRDIETVIKTCDMPYIPGSEIKGAIRTALIHWQLNHNASVYAEFKKRLGALRSHGRGDRERLRKEARKAADWLEDRVFRGGKSDVKRDVMKFLQVSDSSPVPPEKSLAVLAINVVGMSRRVPIFQEALRPEISLEIPQIKMTAIREDLRSIGVDGACMWPLERIENLFQCCHEFSSRLLKEEADYFAQLAARSAEFSWVYRHLQEIAKINSPNSPVLRLGKNEGFLSLSVAVAVKDKDPDLYNEVIVPSTKGRYYQSGFPKTRRLARLAGAAHTLQTLGWCKLAVMR